MEIDYFRVDELESGTLCLNLTRPFPLETTETEYLRLSLEKWLVIAREIPNYPNTPIGDGRGITCACCSF